MPRRPGAAPVFGQKTISLEALHWRFRYSKGLFLLGAGASTGIVPFGSTLMSAGPVDFHDNSPSFSAAPTKKDVLAQRSVDVARTILQARRGQLGFDADLASAKIDRMPSAFANFKVVHIIGKARLHQQVNDLRYRNYEVFNFFPPTVLLNYNLDGVATDICGVHHRVVPVHGTVKAHLGSDETAQLVDRLRESDIDFRFRDLLLCAPEPHFDQPGHDDLIRRLAPMWDFAPDFVAVCGYSFASQDPSGLVHDDHESLRLFLERFKDFDGPIFVLDPSAATKERLEHRLRSRHVISVQYNWNILAAVMIDRMRGSAVNEPLHDAYSRLIDNLNGDAIAVPSKWKPTRKRVFAARGF
jgi:hypothetical protein